MRWLLDFAPLVAFFVAYRLDGIYTATAVLMGATAIQMGVVYALERQLQTLQKVTLALIWVFGALTLALHDERFIKWKPTVLYAALALVLAAALWGWRRNLLHVLLGNQLSLPAAVWRRLTLAWIAYCLFMAILNAVMATWFSTDAWVDFKLWGYIFPLAFILGQGIYIARHLKDHEA
ncbi:putative intracellular septation protein A [Tepidimonas alkaliphilus]|uniref:Inner membrane-spanning protein YciB n=1 Tax=Tepidimonas alkaliphilus TaxID=2588942 RepID=A0A554WA80_9BURK|nr:septation protein A [Tepidimonas alkaliphilus]TSE20462.1 putative intracellular septation protein A [Tepidimonas alkaliphilus]